MLASSDQVEDESNIVYMNGLNKCVTIKDTPLQGKDLWIMGCEDSYIYIDSSAEYVLIS